MDTRDQARRLAKLAEQDDFQKRAGRNRFDEDERGSLEPEERGRDGSRCERLLDGYYLLSECKRNEYTRFVWGTLRSKDTAYIRWRPGMGEKFWFYMGSPSRRRFPCACCCCCFAKLRGRPVPNELAPLPPIASTGAPAFGTGGLSPA